MKNERPWSWRVIKNDSLKKRVTAVIESIDNKSQLQLENIDPKLVDTITSFLTSSYRWGAEEESSIDTIIDENRDRSQPSDEEVDKMVQDAVKPLLEEIEELKDQKTKDAQSIGGLRGQLTKLKAKLEADK
jgi:predicted lipase